MSDRRITCPDCGDDVYADCVCTCKVVGIGREGPRKPSVLEEASRLTSEDRQAVYGHPSANWGRTAEIASALLGFNVSASDCCKVALAMKFARLRQTPDHRDSIVDIAGYAWVLSELEEV